MSDERGWSPALLFAAEAALRRLLGFAILLAFAAFGSTAPAADRAPATEGRPAMKAGFARLSITPPIGTRMMGFGTRDQEHGCTGVHDDIFVRALYLEQGGETALILGFDMCFIGRAAADRIKAALGRTAGLSPREILMNASHSHVGPAVGTWYYPDYTPLDRAYIDLLEEAVVRAATEAQGAARDVTIRAGAGRSALPMNRRRKDEQGNVAMAPNPEGYVFDQLPVCLLEDREGQPVCLLFSVSCHPSMMSGHEISAEYPGAAMELLDRRLGAPVSFFLQGTGGDAKPSVIGEGADRWRAGTWEEMERAGQIVAGEAMAALEKGLAEVRPGLQSELVEVEWPLEPHIGRDGFAQIADDPDAPAVRRVWARRMLERLDSGEAFPEAATLWLQGIALGEGLRVVALEGEPVAPYGALIEGFYDGGVTFPLGYSNGEGLYLPTSEMLDEGGYEVVSYWEYGFPARLTPGFEQILEAALEKLSEAGIR